MITDNEPVMAEIFRFLLHYGFDWVEEDEELEQLAMQDTHGIMEDIVVSTTDMLKIPVNEIYGYLVAEFKKNVH